MFIKSRQLFDELPGDGGQGGGGMPPAGGTPPVGGTPPAWYDGFKNPEVKEWIGGQANAYPDPEAVATKALNLERFISAEKSGRGVVMPKADAKPEEWAEFYKKVGGVPEKPDDYKMSANIKPEVLTQMEADPMVKAFREHAHKSGMPPMFFQSAMDWYVSEMTKHAEQDTTEFARKAEQDMADIKSEWAGELYDRNIEMGRRAAKQFIPHESADELKNKMQRIEGALGTKETLKFWASVGTALGEHGFEQGSGSGGFGGMSPEAARLKIADLKRDSEWTAKFARGDIDSKAEWDRLHKIGYPEQQ